MSLCGYEPCQIEVFGRQKFCSADHRKAAHRAQPESREAEKASARERYSQRHSDHASERKAKLWPCAKCQGLLYHVSKPKDVCSGCRPESHLTSIKVAPRVDDPLRPVDVDESTGQPIWSLTLRCGHAVTCGRFSERAPTQRPCLTRKAREREHRKYERKKARQAAGPVVWRLRNG